MEQYWSDVRTSLRIFRRSPALALTAVLALAMGIGFTTTMFSIVRGGTRALPFAHPDQIVALTRISTRSGSNVDPGRHNFRVGQTDANAVVGPSLPDAQLCQTLAAKYQLREAWITNRLHTARIPARAFGRLQSAA